MNSESLPCGGRCSSLFWSVVFSGPDNFSISLLATWKFSFLIFFIFRVEAFEIFLFFNFRLFSPTWGLVGFYFRSVPVSPVWCFPILFLMSHEKSFPIPAMSSCSPAPPSLILQCVFQALLGMFAAPAWACAHFHPCSFCIRESENASQGLTWAAQGLHGLSWWLSLWCLTNLSSSVFYVYFFHFKKDWFLFCVWAFCLLSVCFPCTHVSWGHQKRVVYPLELELCRWL